MQRSLLSIFFNESGRVPISLNIVEEKYFCTKYNGKIVQGCSRYGIINERCLLIKLWALRQLAGGPCRSRPRGDPDGEKSSAAALLLLRLCAPSVVGNAGRPQGRRGGGGRFPQGCHAGTPGFPRGGSQEVVVDGRRGGLGHAGCGSTFLDAGSSLAAARSGLGDPDDGGRRRRDVSAMLGVVFERWQAARLAPARLFPL